MKSIRANKTEYGVIQQMAARQNVRIKVERKRGGIFVEAPLSFLQELGF